MNSIRNNISTEIKYVFIYKEFLLNLFKRNKIETKKASVSFYTICGDDCICGNNYQKLLDNNCINLKKMR
jgi:hypothetical protein